MSVHRLRWLFLLPAALTCACGSNKASSNHNTPSIKGVVTSEAGAPIANAKVQLPALNASATSDASGNFEVAANGSKVGQSVALTVTHPDYSGVNTPVDLSAQHTSANFSLRPHGVVQTITLPSSATDAPATVAVPGENNGGALLTVQAGELALPNGTAATGSAQVKMTYWAPDQNFVSAPAPLVGQAGADANMIRLYSYGMVNIEVTQGNDVLQVASGRTLGLDFNRPSTLDVNTLTDLSPTDPVSPALWYADANTGTWVAAGTLATGALSVDANDQTMRAKLPHLSAWNIDGQYSTNLCVNGNVIDNCGKPQANQKLTLWLYSNGELDQYTIQTDAAGHYSTNLTGAATNASDRTASFSTWISAFENPNAANCNPSGAKTYSQLCTRKEANMCTGQDIYAPSDKRSRQPVNYDDALAKCGISKTNVPLCGYVPGTVGTTDGGQCMFYVNGKLVPKGKMVSGQCGNLPDVKVPWCGTPPSGVDVCTTVNARFQGDACDKDVDCCPNALLVCQDRLCVPNKDN